MGLNGLIIINAFKIPVQCLKQAQRLKDELQLLGVSAEVVSDATLFCNLADGKVNCQYENIDFAIYLDKNKYLSKMLEETGIRLFNCHDSIRCCDDKGETVLALAGQGFNIPKTYFGELCYRPDMPVNKETLNKIAEELGYPIVVKESFGSMGKGVYLADNFESLVEISEKLKTKPHIFQQYIGNRYGTDVRVIVIGGKVVSAMKRVNEKDFRSNIALGGKGKAIKLNKAFTQVSENIAKKLNLDYCGIDLLYGEGDVPYVCEVNSNAFFEEMESVANVNIARLYAQYIINSLKKV